MKAMKTMKLGFFANLALPVSCYFLVTQPSANSNWQNGLSNLVTWEKGTLDGIDAFDLEIACLSRDGLILVARDDVPPGNDYFVHLVNSTPGIIFATSERFSILSAGTNSTPTATKSSFAKPEPTVTVSGSPNPTQGWIASYPALASKANSALGGFDNFGLGEGARGLVMVVIAVLACVFVTIMSVC
ncbi:hypothetical protein L218DRAFT_956514 [Marasmius fiardii PR-910]|nr:hypothetical protein L218DRAFT_956514 [Marasmius fiardii PR-910]